MKIFGWTLMRVTDVAALRDERDRARRRNEASGLELLEAETQIGMLRTQLADARSTLRECDALRHETIKRAEVAEGVVRGQAKHIEQLQRSNETALQSIVDMRRSGFTLPTDIGKPHEGDHLTSVADDDRTFVLENPEFIAASDD